MEEGEVRNSELMRKIHQYERSAKMALNMAGSYGFSVFLLISILAKVVFRLTNATSGWSVDR